MPFENPIIAGEELIRPGIRSEDFIEGTAGWRIGRDGSAEFNDLVTRGTFGAQDGQFETLSVAGLDVEEQLMDMGGSIAARFDWTANTEDWGGAGPYLITLMPVTLKAGHEYAIGISGMGIATTVAGDVCNGIMRYEWDGASSHFR
jgi:hypothetical protein